MSIRSQHTLNKKAPAARSSALSPMALVVMGLVGAADALAAVRDSLLQDAASQATLASGKTTVLDYNAVASLVQALVREGLAPEEAALRVQVALQSPNPLAALSELATPDADLSAAPQATDALSLSVLVEALKVQGDVLDMPLEAVSQSAGFAPSDLSTALDAFKSLAQDTGAAGRVGNVQTAQNQMDILLAQAAQAGSAVATDAGAATAATASGAASGVSALGALSSAQALALVGFAAVAGGAFSSGDAVATVVNSSSGSVVKGPISGAIVFRDMNGNYILDAGEESTTTSATGAYTLNGTGGKIVATGGTDTTTSLSFTGVLAAPAGATVVTPLTTLLAANSSLTSAELKSALGLTVDPLTFNPFATGVNAADALKAEGAAAQVNTILTNLAVSVNGASAGAVSLADAVTAVATKLATQVIDQAAALKTNASAGTLNLTSDTVLNTLVTNVKTAVSAKATLTDSDFSTALTTTKATNTTISNVVSTSGSISTIASTLKTAQGNAPVVNSSLLPDVTVAEDSALSGTGGTGSLTTLPSTFTANNIGRANLLKFFDNDSSTVGTAPTLTFDMTGYTVTDTGTSSLDLVMSLQKASFAGRSLTVTLNDVKLDAATSSGNTTFTLPVQNISATVKMGSVALGTYTFSNLDSDLLTLAAGSNTVGTAPSFSLKLDSLFAKMTNGTGDVLDVTSLSREGLVALGGALVVGVLDDVTPASIVAKLKSLVTLPASVDTVSELVTLTKAVVNFPEVSSLKISDLLTQISAGSTKTLLLTAASRAGVVVDSATSDTLSSALTKIGATFGTYKLSDLSTLLSNGLGIDAGVDLVTVAKTLIGAALSQAQGLSAETLLDKAIGALVDANNGDLRALLAGVDYQAVVGTHVDVLNVVNNIIQHGTIKYVDLINLGAQSLLSTDATLLVQANDFKNLTVTSGGVAQTSLQVSVPIGSASTFTPPSNGLGIATGAFTDPDVADVLKYTATLESGAALPSWLTFNAATKSFAGTPTNDNVGSINIKVTAIDPAGNTVSDVFKLTVTNVNDAPQLAAGAVTSITAEEFSAVSVDVSKAFTDVDVGDALTFSAASLPSGWSITSAGVLTGTAPLNATNATVQQTINITATDKAGATKTAPFTLNVTNDTTPPAKLTAALQSDNGTSSTDGITSNGTLVVSGLEANATWQYSTNSGSTWSNGSGTSFVLNVGTYAKDVVQVRQIDQAGNNGSATTLAALDIRTAPATPTVTLATPDSGTTGDSITNSGVVNVGALLSGTTYPTGYWQYSTNGGTTWSANQALGTTTFSLAEGSYALDKVVVRQSDGQYESLYGKLATAITIDSTKPVLTETLDGFNASTGVYTFKFVSTESLVGFDASDVTVSANGSKASAVVAIGTDAKTYTLAVTPVASSATSATASSLTASVDATAATDAAGNALSAAQQVAVSVLFGTSVAQTLTGTTGADTLYGGGGNDTISGLDGNDTVLTTTGNDSIDGGAGNDVIDAGEGNNTVLGGDGNDAITAGAGTDSLSGGAGNDTISAGAGNDTVAGGAGADTLNLGTGTDVVKLLLASDSSASAADTVTGFGTGDKIDLSSLIGTATGGAGYTGEASLNYSASSPVELSNWKSVAGTTAGTTKISVDVLAKSDLFTGVSATSSVISLTFDATAVTKVAQSANPDLFSLPTYQLNTNGTADFVLANDGAVSTIAKGTLLTTVSFTIPSTSTLKINMTDLSLAAGTYTSSPALPLQLSTTGTTITSTATDLKYTIIDDGTSLTTVGDNEIHFANNSTTGGVDIRYDTNKSAGTTALSDIIHLDGITGIDLSKTDFTFV